MENIEQEIVREGRMRRRKRKKRRESMRSIEFEERNRENHG
jgi:hypothetical protein